jgi:hypothetical protein
MQLPPLTLADLLQADVTIITGVLILLTISISVKRENAKVFGGMGMAPIGFALSAGLIAFNSFTGLDIDYINVLAVAAFLAGLLHLTILVIWIVKAIVRSQSR